MKFRSKAWIRSFIVVHIIFISIILFLRCIVGNIVFVYGDSMKPTLQSGDIVAVNKLYKFFSVGDIVLVRDSRFERKYVIKRIVATEGQTISFDYDKNEIEVDGEMVFGASATSMGGPDPMEAQNGRGFEMYTVPSNCLFLMGDNMNSSFDSRSPQIGYVPISSVVGKVVLYKH